MLLGLMIICAGVYVAFAYCAPTIIKDGIELFKEMASEDDIK